MRSISLKLFTTAMLACVSVAANAYDFTLNGIYYSKLSDNTVEVTKQNPLNPGYRGTTELTIPSIVIYGGKEYTVTGIAKETFANSRIQAINLPSTLTTIGDSAFCSCYLSSITIPNGVTSIGKYAFYEISTLKSVTIPNSITNIGEHAFDRDGHLTSITLPENITTIPDGLFQDCIELTSIVLPSKVRSIGAYAFSGCYWLESVNIPDGVTTIGACAFESCLRLKSVNIPASVSSIGEYAFICLRFAETIKVDDDNKVYDSRNNCNAIIETATNKLLFGSINGTVPDGVKTIATNAFCDLYKLTKLTIPASVMTFEEKAITDCTNLADVYDYATEPQTPGDTVFVADNMFVLHVVKGCKEKYAAVNGWNQFTIVEDLEPSGIEELTKDAVIDEKVYSTSGVRLKNAQKGLNVIRGKKYILK